MDKPPNPKMLIKLLVLGAGLLGLSVAAFYAWATASTYPIRRYAEVFRYGEPAAAGQETYTVVSYNIGYLSGLTNNLAVERERSRFEQNLAVAIAALAPLRPDLIALQEIDLDARRSFHTNQVQALAEGLQLPVAAVSINWDKTYVPFPYWPPPAHFGKILSGQAVLSRYPVQKNDRIVLPKVANQPFYYQALYLDRLAQVTQVQLGDRPVILINLHLEAFDAPTRSAQTAIVKDLAERYAQNYPVLLVGDFNSAVNRPEEGELKTIEQLAESSVLAPAGDRAAVTFPSDQPRYRLDYLFYTPATIELVSSQVVTTAGTASDHLPIAATFRLR